MSSLYTFYNTTINLIDALESREPQDRDQKIALVEKLLSERETLISAIQPPFSNQDKELGRKLAELNQKATLLLTDHMAAIRQDIKQLSVKKESVKKYTNSFLPVSNDGMFYDKRK